MMLLDLSKGFWKALTDYLSLASDWEVLLSVIGVLSIIVLLYVLADWGMNPHKYEDRWSLHPLLYFHFRTFPSSLSRFCLELRFKYEKTINDPLLKLYSKVISVAHGFTRKSTKLFNKIIQPHNILCWSVLLLLWAQKHNRLFDPSPFYCVSSPAHHIF